MSSTLGKIYRHCWVIFILYMGFNIYEKFTENEEQFESINVQRNKLQRDIKKRRDLINKSKEFKDNLESVKERVESIARSIEKVQKQLPSKTNDTEILGMFQEQAKLINIKRPSVTQGKEDNSGFYFSKEYNFEGQGTWLQLLIFFESLSEKERIFNVKDLSVRKVDSKRKGRFQMLDFKATMEAYRYNPNHREKVEEIPISSNAPKGKAVKGK